MVKRIVVMGGSFNSLVVAIKQDVVVDAMKVSVNEWRGENLLGCALMEVRDWLRGS